MGIEAKSRTIDGIQVVCAQFAGRRGFKLKAKLIKTLGPGLLTLLKSVSGSKGKKSALDADVELGSLGEGIEALVGKLSEDQWLDLVEELLDGTTLNGMSSKDAFDSVFSANYPALYKILGFVLEVNYGSFLGQNGIGTLTDKLKSMTQSKK